MKRQGWALLLVLLVWGGAAAEERLITDVQVKGSLRVEPGLILQQVKSQAGEPYDPDLVREDVRAIYGMGYFEDVVADLSDEGVLTFLVLERPALREWRTEGADKIDKEDLQAAVNLRAREILNEGEVAKGAQAIRQLYREKGYYLAEVESEVVPVPDGTNSVDVVYRVTEGQKVKIKEVNLIDVEKLSKKDLLKQMATREANLWSWITGSGTFKEPELERDREVLRSYYLNHGFAEAEVLEPLVTLTPDRKWLRIDLPVVEGESYDVGKISFSGDLEFSEEELRSAAALEEGATFRSNDFRNAHQALTDLYADIGYAFVDVDPKTRLRKEERLIDVEFQIHKGELVHIGRIEIRGNTKTRDRVIRREMRVDEGELYSASAIRLSQRKIQNLGFFETVNLTTHRRPGTELLDVSIEVEEKTTGSFSIGAGYSSVDKIIGMATISQRNFLGLGYQLSLNASLGTTRSTYSFTFNNPRVFDSQIYAGIDLYNTTREYVDYDKDAIGGALKLGTALTDEWSIRGIYGLEKADVTNVDSTASTTIKDQEGITVTSSLTGILTFDDRDDPYEPHSGWNAEGSVEWAGGLLGGDSAFLKYIVDGSKYIPLWLDHVLTLHSRVGYIMALEGKEIPIFERFVLGGINSLRGFKSRDVGPRDPETGDVIGGDKEVLFNIEYLFPLIKEAKLRGLVFFDTGNVWDVSEYYFQTSLRRSVGAGIRWFSPMGPLRLEWGYVLDKKEDEDQSRWEFSVGGFF